MARSWTELDRDALTSRYREVRALTQALSSPLSDADATVQSMPDASPAKWHLAHGTWFFETFVLRDHVPDYQPFDPRYAFLFNSYYEAEGARHARPMRGMLTRPSLDEVRDYRAHVDAAVLAAIPMLSREARTLVTLGLHHEQQHQELMLTDLLHLFSLNPMEPALFAGPAAASMDLPDALHWIEGREGLVEIGDEGRGGFAFDCEGPRHKALLHPHALGHRPITNGEWIAFIEDGGYRTAAHWLADGWAWVQAESVDAPAYWAQGEQGWTRFGLDGRQPVNPAAPVTHISLYEADAYASWAGARLPTEAEWESAAQNIAPTSGNLLDGAACPRPHPADATTSLTQMFGDVWEWTGSAYRPHPGFRAAPGAVGEYNGKFMSGQFVLKGGSCATPRGHVRASYRNFFYPHQRWQFTGLRLAKDL
ncbi:ergothioneine biosynthesis protein EgtB [Sphingobium xenophagum]|uniref:Ergothioneine biosynthesis protein EgtB n=1 Tax=Sphingobium xenophagum TaxID=121428 RepID=A0ABU1WW78_SPHXE|nr:ergothioneine biosynthesis protein EgtB [Sphingobium xenophagum]MDR7153434.1 ergothioneine biosynthesis protein EgtB [Sphingobium xenophagum]